MLKKFILKLLGSQLFKDSFWSITGNVVGKGLALVAGIVVARFLGKDIYGEYGIIRNTILTVGVFSTFGLGYTATKYVAEFKQNRPELIKSFIKIANKITIFFSGFMALLLFLFANIISTHWLDAPHLSSALRILSVLIVFNAITTTQIGILAGFGRFKQIAIINSVIGLLTFLLSLVLTYFYNLNGALTALLVVQIMNCLFNYWIVKKETAYLNFIEKTSKLTKEILRFSTPIALREAVYSITSWMLAIFIIKFSNYGELGMYNAAMQWNAIILFIPGVLKNVILSHLSKNNSNLLTFNTTIKRMMIVNFITTSIPLCLVFFSSELIERFYGNSFEGVGVLISLALITAVLSSTSGVIMQSFISLGKNWLMLYLSIFRELSIFCLGFLFIRYNFYGGSKSIILASIIANFLFTIVVYFKYLSIKNSFKTAIPIIKNSSDII